METCFLCGERFCEGDMVWWHFVDRTQSNHRGDYGGLICNDCYETVRHADPVYDPENKVETSTYDEVP